jgi:arylformamidase
MRQWIDITRPMNDRMNCWPGRTPPVRTWDKSIAGGDHCNASSWRLSAHTGTHMDAPLHFCRNGLPIDQIPLEVFAGPCTVVDLIARNATVLDVDIADEIVGAQRLLIRSTHSNPDQLTHYNDHEAILTPDAARCLLDGGLLLIGTDRLTVDDARGEAFTLHHLLLGEGCAIIEGLWLADVQPGQYELHAAPLRMTHAEASPVRALLRNLEP